VRCRHRDNQSSTREDLVLNLVERTGPLSCLVLAQVRCPRGVGFAHPGLPLFSLPRPSRIKDLQTLHAQGPSGCSSENFVKKLLGLRSLPSLPPFFFSSLCTTLFKPRVPVYLGPVQKPGSKIVSSTNPDHIVLCPLPPSPLQRLIAQDPPFPLALPSYDF
jgi:hypothetical protein